MSDTSHDDFINFPELYHQSKKAEQTRNLIRTEWISKHKLHLLMMNYQKRRGDVFLALIDISFLVKLEGENVSLHEQC